MEPQSAMIQLQHPTRDKGSPRIAMEKYEAVRAAILKVVPQDGDGLRFTDLAAEVERALPTEALATLGSVGWYTTAVKLDLEARGLIERVPGAKPQRVRRVAANADQLGQS